MASTYLKAASISRMFGYLLSLVHTEQLASLKSTYNKINKPSFIGVKWESEVDALYKETQMDNTDMRGGEYWETKIPSQKAIIKSLLSKIINKGAVLIRYPFLKIPQDFLHCTALHCPAPFFLFFFFFFFSNQKFLPFYFL